MLTSSPLSPFFASIDWSLLKEQKQHLVNMASDKLRPAAEIETLDGIISLIDGLQDEMVKVAPSMQAAVFESDKHDETPELRLEAVKQDGWALQHVPEELRTPEMCIEAVKQDGWALQFVPQVLRTPEICLEAVKQDREALKYVPEVLRTPEMCLEAVKQDGWALEHVPQELRTHDLCLEAVRQDGEALEYVPEELLETVRCATNGEGIDQEAPADAPTA